MYLHEIFLQNTGPITECHVNPQFDENGNPLPIVIVGPNGSGKTIFLSYIVDALTEFAKKAFVDVVPSDSPGRTPYFRMIHQRAIRSGERFSLSLLHFKANNIHSIHNNDSDLHYCEKSGYLDPASYSPCVKSVFDPVWNWKSNGDYKLVSVDIKTVYMEMRKQAHAFFPASRREDPDWLNPKSLQARLVDYEGRGFNNELNKPLWVETCAEENISWVLDVFLDSFIDPDEQQIENYFKYLEEYTMGQQITLQQSRENVEQILQTILQDETAKLFLNFRYFGPSRISIKMDDERITIPALQSLSAGQSQLFNLFATIIRYGEWRNLNNSLDLSRIAGLVVIDEIAAHLHPMLQHDVLPELISLFPKVQFIVSSHAPLFLIGMEKRFGRDKVTILEMPNGNRINSERYSEFRNAFEIYKTTERFEEDIKQLIANATKPVVLTEGKTDAKYIQTALQLLGEETLLNSLEIQPVGVKVGQEWKYGGKDGLNRVKTFYRKDPSLLDRMLLLLYDWDTPKTEKSDGKIWVRSIPKNTDDPDNKGGIENLFPVDLFGDQFYDEEPKKGVHGRDEIKPEFKKKDFCEWICGERRNPADFDKFKGIVEILKEFLEAAQTPPIQQPLSE
ncbi:MAG: AAA family ATPase [Candidatus Poribacteria bacterium]|nr:AAA family ATPase [Candidatus Poribacteria bacterium]